MDGKKYLKLEDVNAYVISRSLSKTVWEEIITWNYFSKRTVGDQLVRAIDSVGASIAEGFGRYHKKDKIKFYYNARGSIYETFHWINISFERSLISKTLYEKLVSQLRTLPKEVNYLIKITNEKLIN